jgi:signal transduction histidine kinase
MDDKTINVLLIEDNPGDARLIREMLAEATGVPFHLEWADHLQPGLQRLGEGEIDVVLLDLSLPDSFGLDTLGGTHAQAPQVPIVVLTGGNDEIRGIKAVKQGAQDYLIKGEINGHLLVRAMRYAIERKEAERVKTEYIDSLQEKNKELQDLLEKLRNTQAQLIQSAKMASLGQLVAGIAHELNNPISFVYSNIKRLEEYSDHISTFYHNCQALFEEIAEGGYPQLDSHLKALKYLVKEREVDFLMEDLRDLVKETQEGADRVRKVVESLRNFSRAQEERQAVDINEALETTLYLLRNQMKNRIVTLKNYGHIPKVECLPNQIKEVFLNLLTNACQAIPDKGEITLQTAEKNGKVLVHISDTGKGIPKENLHKIFEPFYTTKPANKGTGLGLSIVRGIIENHGGEIYVKSQIGRGTTFTVSLPLGGEKREVAGKKKQTALSVKLSSETKNA